MCQVGTDSLSHDSRRQNLAISVMPTIISTPPITLQAFAVLASFAFPIDSRSAHALIRCAGRDPLYARRIRRPSAIFAHPEHMCGAVRCRREAVASASLG